MTCLSVVELVPLARADKHEAPGECGGVAENLRVHQVAEPDEATDEGNGDDETVKCPYRVALGGEN